MELLGLAGAAIATRNVEPVPQIPGLKEIGPIEITGVWVPQTPEEILNGLWCKLGGVNISHQLHSLNMFKRTEPHAVGEEVFSLHEAHVDLVLDQLSLPPDVDRRLECLFFDQRAPIDLEFGDTDHGITYKTKVLLKELSTYSHLEEMPVKNISLLVMGPMTWVKE